MYCSKTKSIIPSFGEEVESYLQSRAECLVVRRIHTMKRALFVSGPCSGFSARRDEHCSVA